MKNKKLDNKNAAESTKAILISTRITPDARKVSDEVALTDAELMEILADCATLLACRASKGTDSEWHVVWPDRRASTERDARIAAGVEQMLKLRARSVIKIAG